MDETLMTFEEKSTYRLRSLYRKHGYMPYKMGKFEEYELYIRNKDFLVSDRVIAFNDTNGKMMALKPDVTLSIIKNGEDVPGVKQKVFYNENVYRVSESTHRFKEIMQTGLECIGDIDIYDIYETVLLAAESLSEISDDFRIEISNLDMVRSIITSVCDDVEFVSKVIQCISEKNKHELKIICDEFSVSAEENELIESLISVYGERKSVINALTKRFDLPQLHEMAIISELLEKSPFSDKIMYDFSIVNDMNYYNGFVFNGFVKGVCFSVLAGGQYDNMMKKMNRKSGAVGFAIYFDRMENLYHESKKNDVDYLLLYDEKTDVKVLSQKVSKLTENGYSVSTQKSIPEKLRYKNLLDLREVDK